MPRAVTLLAALAAAWLGFSPPAEAAEADGYGAIRRNREARIAIDPGFPPAAYFNKDQQLVGFDVDIAAALAKRLGARAKIVHPAWQDMIYGHWHGKWDLAVSSITPTAERAEHLDFPAIYYYNPVSIAVHRDNLSAQTVYDLDGKTLGACDHCTTEAYLKKALAIQAPGAPLFAFKLSPGEVKSYINDQAALDDLSAGDGLRLDGVLAATTTIRHAIAAGAPLRVLDEPVFHEPLAIAIPKGQPRLARAVQEAVEDMRKKGELQNLSYQWFGEDMTKHPGQAGK